MAVNRFDQPTQVEYISQYTPIPFQELYTIGKEYNNRVDKAFGDLTNAIKSYRQFKSPSAVDTNKYYNLTLKGAEDIADQIAKNPDYIKTLEAQAQIQRYISSRPYAELSMLEQSRDNMLQRQKNVQELIKKGTYNPLWHDYDFTNYNTLKSGLFKDVDVLPYMSELDLVKPYLDNLKDSYIRTEGRYDYYGVTKQRVADQINPQMSAIMRSPYSREHIKALMKQGYNLEDALKIFGNNIYTAANEFAHESRKTNPFAAMQYQDQLARARWREQHEDSDNPNNPEYLTNQIQRTGSSKYAAGFADLVSADPNYSKIIKDLNSSDKAVRDKANEMLNQLYSQYETPTKVFRKVFDYFGTKTKKGGLNVTSDQLNQATNYILNKFSFPIQGTYGQLLLNTIPGISSKEQNTELGKFKTIANGANLDLTTRGIAAIAGLYPSAQPAGQQRNKFLNALKGGELTNLIVLGNERIMSLPSINIDGSPTTQNFQTVRVAIPATQVKDSGLTEEDMKKVGAVKRTLPGSTTITNTLSGPYSDGKAQYDKSSSSIVTKGDIEYYEVSLMSEIPMNLLGAEYLNQGALKQNMSSSDYSSLYPDVQASAFDILQLENQ